MPHKAFKIIYVGGIELLWNNLNKVERFFGEFIIIGPYDHDLYDLL